MAGNIGPWIIGGVIGILGLLGLHIAAHGEGASFYRMGLALAGFAIVLIFLLIKSSFDRSA